ncbi:peptide/nickel transport system permease protein [Propionibacterium cyclohexanicum]|uniref:Peptide/nickel transport system permease protein n=1 Tax=Propionibacterium cyclohexanicum TaxID=64702 RepID=A0A1H9Q043_9ACTN|nr:ABC transporter permease [Propionibacterium cyclohexanicum]SER53455.1 peptide/nickel transport system permease protein [Propionibacterium cyclohexanicum]
MIKLLVRRSTSWLILIVVATNVTYLLANLFLDPRSNYRETRPIPSEKQIDDSLAAYGLDPRVPLIERWWSWLRDIVLHFDWGRSPNGGSVNAEMAYRTLVSAQLVLIATVLCVIVGVGLGVVSAIHQYGVIDRVLQAVSILLYNVPTVVMALLLVFGAIRINESVGHTLFLVAGSQSPQVSGLLPTIVDRLAHLLLPTVSLTLLGYVGYHLTQRSLLLDTINADFVRTARATGLPYGKAIRRHALRAALIPTATSVAFSIPGVFTGAIITESIFGWHGMGEYFSLTLAKNDVNGVVAVAAFGALMTAIGAILADIATAFLDPRVRLA